MFVKLFALFFIVNICLKISHINTHFEYSDQLLKLSTERYKGE